MSLLAGTLAGVAKCNGPKTHMSKTQIYVQWRALLVAQASHVTTREAVYVFFFSHLRFPFFQFFNVSTLIT